jgi:hypothetical protein
MNFFFPKTIICAYQVFIIQNLDVVNLELGVKVCDLWKYYFNLTNYAKLANFWQTEYTKILLSADKQ